MSVNAPGSHLTCFMMNFLQNKPSQDFAVNAGRQAAFIDQTLGAGSRILREKPRFSHATGDDPFSVYRLGYSATAEDLQNSIVAEHKSPFFQAELIGTEIHAQILGIKEIFRRGVYSSIPDYGVDNPFYNPEHGYYLIISLADNAPNPERALEKCKVKWTEFSSQNITPGSIMGRWTGKPPENDPPSYQWSIGFATKKDMKELITQFSDFTVDEGFNIRAFKVVDVVKEPPKETPPSSLCVLS
jgi:hypothetical protein